MVGVIHRVLFQLVDSLGGREAVDRVRQLADVPADREFKMQVPYDDAEWRRLMRATCEVLEVTPEQALEAYAGFFLKDALTRWPMWFRMSANSRQFLARQPSIHNSLSAGLLDPSERQAVSDKFHVEVDGERIVTRYHSPNQLCGLYKALARGVIEHYGDAAVITERGCMLRGDPECEITVEWTRLKVAA
jgi:hypothetical protein